METLNKTQLELSEWLNNQLRYNNVPRLVDVRMHVQRQGLDLTKKQVAQVVRLHPQYKMNMPQQRNAGKSKTYRPVVVTELGHWHADIGFFSINKRYETPITYRAGYLVAKDILSRKVYATPLLKNRTADSIISAFTKLFKEHAQHLPNTPIRSIAFDQETSVLSKKVQSFFAERGITCHHPKPNLPKELYDK
jgi:transposase InsO family protein